METSVTKYESRTRLRDDPREEYVHRSKHEELLLPQREAADGPSVPEHAQEFLRRRREHEDAEELEHERGPRVLVLRRRLEGRSIRAMISGWS